MGTRAFFFQGRFVGRPPGWTRAAAPCALPRVAMHALLAGATWLDANLNHTLHFKKVTRVKSGTMHRMVHVPANRTFGLSVDPLQQACQAQRLNRSATALSLRRIHERPTAIYRASPLWTGSNFRVQSFRF